jgi:hypothetical protein
MLQHKKFCDVKQRFPSRVSAKLLPLSESKNLGNAFDEWRYTDNCHDLDEPIAKCQLCGHFPIRFHFEIANRHNGNCLLVGSECVKRFGIDGAESIASDQRDLVKDAKHRSAINSLVELSAVDDEFAIDSFIDYMQDQGGFTPNQMKTLIWRFADHGIEFDPRCFKVKIRRDRARMPRWTSNTGTRNLVHYLLQWNSATLPRSLA